MQEKVHFGVIFLGKMKSENGKRGVGTTTETTIPWHQHCATARNMKQQKFCTTKIIGEPYTATSYCNGEWNE